MKDKVLGFLKKHRKGLIILLILVILVGWGLHACSKAVNEMAEGLAQTATPEVMDLQESITGSGTIAPNDQYVITPMVQGEIVSAPFEEGDTVEKGQLLFQFSTENAQDSIQSAELSLEQAKLSYQDALETKEQNEKSLSLKAEQSGYVKKLYVEKGDTIAAGTVIADLYDNTAMVLTIPFNAADVKESWIGKKAVVEVGDEGELVSGKVTGVSSVTTTLSGNRIVKDVTIEVKNPGGISVGDTATAEVAGVACNSEGSFAVKSEGTLLAAGSGTIETLAIVEGNYVKRGEVYLTLEDATIGDSVANADLTLRGAQNQLDSAQKSLDDYSIDAPISGTVITKNAKEGDTINATYQGSLAVIYDLSKVKFQMKVDELDVLKIEVGQEVSVTADALEGVTMTGHITNISLEAVTNGGVTEYPVTVEMDEVGQLLPGMNVSASIIISEEKDAMCVPVDALQRGDYVYVKDQAGTEPSTEAADPMVPAGFHKVPVTVGVSNASYVQILSGLSMTDEVYVPSAQLTDIYTMMYGDSYVEEDADYDETYDDGAAYD